MNNNHHKPQSLQIVWQYFLSVLLMTLFVINYQFVAAILDDKLIDISAINTDLGVFENNPSIKEISHRIKELNQNLKNSHITKNCNIEIVEAAKSLESKGKVTIIAKDDSKTIKGKIELFFDIKQDLNDLIENKDLGEFELKKINTKAPEIEELKIAILNLNPHLDLEQIEFIDKNLESEKLIIKAKLSSLKYKGKNQFTYKIKKIDKKIISEEIVKEIMQDAQEQKNVISLENHEESQKQELKNLKKTVSSVVEKELKQKDATKESVLNKGREVISLTPNQDTNIELISENNENNENIQNINDNGQQPEESPILTSKTTNNKISFLDNNKYIIYIVIASIVGLLLVLLGIFFFCSKKIMNKIITNI